jgi:hypothetical protein
MRPELCVFSFSCAHCASSSQARGHRARRPLLGARSRPLGDARRYVASGGAVSAELAASPPAFEDGGAVNVSLVSLSGASTSPDDFISVTCGDVHGNATDFLDAITLGDASSAVFGPGLPFLRCAYRFTYWSTVYSPSLSWVAAGALLVPPAEPFSAPKQIHVGVTASPHTSASVSWTSGGALAGEQGVQFAREGGAWAWAPAASRTYKASDMCYAPATWVGQNFYIDPGLMHSAVLDGLTPATAYAYRVGSAADGWSRNLSFTTVAAPGAPVRFAAFGDVDSEEGAWNTSRLVAAAVARGEVDFVHVNGDLSYAMSTGW